MIFLEYGKGKVSRLLQKIPLDMYDEVDYSENKGMYFDEFNKFLHGIIKCNAIQAVKSTYHHSFSSLMDENGMDKFVAMLSGMLYMIEHDMVDPDVAFGTNYDINDFESGEYDDLFTLEDLKLIKTDIKVIKDYLKEHPELIED